MSYESIWDSELKMWLRPISGGGPPPVSPPVSPPPPPPPAIPAFVANPPGAVPGSKWVEGAELHYIASNGAEYSETGTSVATPPGAVVGSSWLESDDIHYIDSSGVERTITKTSLGAKPAPAITGSEWVHSPAAAGAQVTWISTANFYRWSNT